MKKLTEAVKQMLDALAFANAGEHLSMKEKTSILEEELSSIDNKVTEVAEPGLVRSNKTARRVAIYLGSELPPEVMDYVIQTCSRLQHALTVLTFQSGSTARTLLKPHLALLEANGIDMELATLSGDPVTGLSRYLRGHPEIVFLACKDSGYLGRSYLNGTQRKNSMPVPVVVVTTADNTSEKPQSDTALSAGNSSKAEVA